MSSEILTDLLSEYEQKKHNAELDLEKRKKELYIKIPRLQEIENELNAFAINTAKCILNGSSVSLDSLSQKASELKKEKEKILLENNINTDYLEPFYNCKMCKDTGYIHMDGKGSVLCPCLKQKLLDIAYNKSNISNLDKENFNAFDPTIFSDKIDKEKFKVNISPRDNILAIKQKSIEFVENFDNSNYKNLLFTGNTGLGKTFISNCIANELIKKGKNVLYQTAPVLLENVIDYKMNKYKNSNQSNFYKNVLEADLLIIDDLGTECINSMKLSELFTILNTRLLNLNNKITKTIISTNLGINNIFKNYEERIGSRIAGFYDIYYFFGDDLRFRKKA
jgi:DNA replication protein DnaC